ncbi:MAG TPA: DUF418 domain-containing protein [Stenotrophomonas sp.]|nr:DUF418 domain-containing protein [Stenotrophomonas sp.]
MKPTALQPIAPAERIVLLDVLRGFALFGILLMNIEGFVGPLNAALTGVDPGLSGANRLADAAVYFFVQGKFYTLFSLLFGMGFAVMSARAEGARRPFVPMYLRRSGGLLLIGLAHALLLWSGDILVSYALLSLLLLAFVEAPTRWLPALALVVYLFASAWVLLFGAIGTLAQHDAGFQQQIAEVGRQWQHALEAQRQAFGAGTYAQATAQRAGDLGESLRSLLVNGPTMLGMFLLGTWFVRSGVIAAPDRHARLFALLRWGALPLGIALMAVSYRISPWMDPARLDLSLSLAWALASLANLLMCLGYLAWVTRWVAALAWLAAAGRMALSNYLLQSLVCTLLFYGYGAGLFERLPRAWQPAFALGLFALQVLASHAWLHYFRFGPVEWLWRGFTYLQWPPLRRRNGVA